MIRVKFIDQEIKEATGDLVYLKSPTVKKLAKRKLEIIFVKEYKFFINKFNKKSKNDYILNVNKIVKDKIGEEFLIPNKVQAFIINYEIKKLLDKAINIRNAKYDRIIYLNNNLSLSGLMNTLDFLSAEYEELVKFKYSLIDGKDDFRGTKPNGIRFIK